MNSRSVSLRHPHVFGLNQLTVHRLLVVSRDDVASVRLGEALLKVGQWEEDLVHEGGQVHRAGPHRMWWLQDRVLHEDLIDERFSTGTGFEADEVLFLSRHAAATGRPCLTVHPIGVLDAGPSDTQPEFGGRRGHCPPPARSFSPWLDLLEAMGRKKGFPDGFTSSAEATHHGPWLTTPTVFIEVGSDFTAWDSVPPATFWADVLALGLGLTDTEDTSLIPLVERVRNPPSLPMLVGIGGGHYAVRHRDVARKHEVLLGHIVPTWAFGEVREDGSFEPEHLSTCLAAAISATRLVAAGQEVVAYLDRKSMRAAARQQIANGLDELGVRLIRSKDLNPRKQVHASES